MLVDAGVIRDAQNGDACAFNSIVLAYRRRVLGTVTRLISRVEDAEDVGQEVFFRLYDSLGQLRSPQVFETWLYRLTVNACYDYLRRSRRRPEYRMADLTEEQVVLADAEASRAAGLTSDYNRKVREVVDTLLSNVSEEDRVLLTLKEVEGLSLKELEQIYEVNQNALKVRLHRARQRVLKSLQPVASRLRGKRVHVTHDTGGGSAALEITKIAEEVNV